MSGEGRTILDYKEKIPTLLSYHPARIWAFRDKRRMEFVFDEIHHFIQYGILHLMNVFNQKRESLNIFLYWLFLI